jgi:hypothetical protein
MTKSINFPFNSHDSYKTFTSEQKQQAEKLNGAIRQEKLAIKEKQRTQNNQDVSYLNLFKMREQIQEAQKLRAMAKLEASRQYSERMA